MKRFTPLIIRNATLPQLLRLRPLYEHILLAHLDCIIGRFAQNKDYPFIDTKLDCFTGEDLSRRVGGVDIFGRETIYSWIQSRGIEALCGHSLWIRTLALSPARKRQYGRDIRRIVRCVTETMERIRRKNGRHLFFWMDRKGEPFVFDTQSRRISLRVDPQKATFSDMFHAKALLAAAAFLNDRALLREARRYFSTWIRCVKANRTESDQQPFDPKNPAGAVPGRRSHADRMISLGGLALAVRLFNDPVYARDGFSFIRYILDHHVNTHGRFPGLATWDFVEYIDATGRPYPIEGHILCDPGHTAEFVGLAFKFLHTVGSRFFLTRSQRDFLRHCNLWLPQILLHAVELGRNPQVGGICKTVSLSNRQPYNSDMPWWNLPETMRAAAFAAGATPDTDTRVACLDVARRCSNVFLTRFVNPNVHFLAYQTLDAQGRPVRIIPATPDLDPGYHTGLSIIDFFAELERQAEEKP